LRLTAPSNSFLYSFKVMNNMFKHIDILSMSMQ
jgi:hypothetical protein